MSTPKTSLPPPTTIDWTSARNNRLYGFDENGRAHTANRSGGDKNFFIVRTDPSVHALSLDVLRDPRTRLVATDRPRSFVYYAVPKLRHDERPESFIARLTRSFRTFAAITCHNLKYSRRWTFVLNHASMMSRNLDTVASLVRNAVDELTERVWLVPPPTVVANITVNEPSRCTYLTVEWDARERMIDDMNRYLKFHDKLPQIVGLNLPNQCRLYRDIDFSQHSTCEKYLAWDIECTSASVSKSLPYGRNPNDRLIQIAVSLFSHNIHGELKRMQNVLFILTEKMPDPTRVDEWQTEVYRRIRTYRRTNDTLRSGAVSTTRIIACPSERLLILSFHSMIEQEMPTAIIGYNTSGFDVPFLKDKEALLHMSKCLPVVTIRRKVFAETKRIDLDFPGVATIDLILEMKLAQPTEFRLDNVSEERNMSLDHFSKKFLKDKKEELSYNIVDQCLRVLQIWSNDEGSMTSNDRRLVLDLLFYGLKDTILPYLLSRCFGMLPTKRAVAKIFHCPIDAVTMQGITAQYPYYYARQMYNKRKPDIIPCPFDMLCAPTQWDIGHAASMIDAYYSGGFGGAAPTVHPPYEGALVTPIAGLYHNVGIFDFASLYPSMILYANLGRETIVSRDEDVRLYRDTCKRVTFTRVDGSEKVVYIRQDVESVLAELLRSTLRARKDIKKELASVQNPTRREILSAQEKAMKIVSNSLYGAKATGTFHDRRVSELTTALARMAFFNVYTAINEIGYEIINGDTDSIMIPDMRNRERAKHVCDAINAALDATFGEKALTLEFERYATHLWVLNSKKYVFRVACNPCAKCNNSGFEIIYKGLKLVKGDTPEYIKGFEKELIAQVLSSNDDEYPRMPSATPNDRIMRHIVHVTEKLLDNMPDMNFGHFVIKQSVRSIDEYVNKNLPQVKALEQKLLVAQDRHTPGDRIKYILCWTIEEPGSMDRRCRFTGREHLATLPKYRRVRYIPTDAPELTEPFGQVAARWRVYTPSLLQQICTTAQSYFASTTFLEDRRVFCQHFNALAARFFPNFKRTKNFTLNRSVPAGIEELDGYTATAPPAPEEDAAEDGCSRQLFEDVRRSTKIPAASRQRDNIYYPRLHLEPI